MEFLFTVETLYGQPFLLDTKVGFLNVWVERSCEDALVLDIYFLSFIFPHSLFVTSLSPLILIPLYLL